MGLCNDISATDDGDDRTLLDGGRFLEVVSIDTAQEIFFQVESFDCIGISSALVYIIHQDCTHRWEPKVERNKSVHLMSTPEPLEETSEFIYTYDRDGFGRLEYELVVATARCKLVVIQHEYVLTR